MDTRTRLSNRKGLTIDPGKIFLLLLSFFVFSPLTLISTMSGMVGDTAIQIRLGLDGIDSGKMILDEIYSWHEGLTFTAHEEGWYLLLGAMYKLSGIIGVILVGTVFNYTTSTVAWSYYKDKAHPLICALVVIITPFLSGFPDYNVRPSVVSAAAFTVLIVLYVNGARVSYISAAYIVSSFILAWMHGGMLPVFMLLMAVFTAVEFVYGAKRKGVIQLISIVAGFVVSLLNPIGINGLLFGFRQMSATDIWSNVDEWKPMAFSIFEAFVLLLFVIGMVFKDETRRFDKKAVAQLLTVCMFFIATCVYKRFALYLSICFLLFAPESFSQIVTLLNENLFRIRKNIRISAMSYRLLSGACAVMMILSVIMNAKYFPTNSMSDIEKMAAYDDGVTDLIEEKGYTRIFNSFNTGSWLAFHGISVHIDNRIDPYMREYSDEDHIRGQMFISNLTELEDFRDRYHPDAIVLDLYGDYSLLLRQIREYAPDRYLIVYDRTITSTTDDDLSIRWVVLECVY